MSRTVVLVHGLRTSSTMWDPQVERLRERGWTCISPDLPGHGSRRDETFTSQSALDTIRAALLEASTAGPAHLVGCSLGGMLAIHAAARFPEVVRSLVASGCSTQPGRRSAAFYGRLIGWTDRAGEAPLRRVLGPAGAEAYLRRGRADLATVAAGVRAVAQFDLLADLASIDAPVTILNGRFDQFRGQERRFARAARRGRLVVLGYGTHMVNLTHPGPYTDRLERLLLEAEAAS
ncbi:alpha/beta hydrolase [Tessaracoccus sp. MC1865]|uniref:alpha/beta fold hydrolase n=1 Tax=Tessaracoccus sp. MC1865 TaxID=2760310 RepID=UPI001601AF50|nr:alpha/beta hydrolase [Tessaracoccus sp. MC1865]MBB1484130.1 alpha/beta hydrolase [Tessaracoccus sp. MC1865]QTO37157.1 alpha/beta hydrolase [Tessaracoccus sp. MC1865]